MPRAELDPVLLDLSKWLASVLSMFMLIGLLLLQLGFCRAKNAVSILLAQLCSWAMATLAYALVGFGFMYGASRGWIGTDGFWARLPDDSAHGFGFLLLQTLVCSNVAAIAQGGLVERAKLGGHALTSLFVALLIYPLFGAWVWGSRHQGGGWLEAGTSSVLAGLQLPAFLDVAGGTAVHSVGGWVALAASVCIGARSGKFDSTGNELPLLGHSMVLVSLGGLCFWLGSFGALLGLGLDSGAASAAAARAALGLAAFHAQLAGAAGASAAMLTSWRINGKPDIGVSISGGLAGLVACSAGASLVTTQGALALGFVAGVLVVAAILWAERHGIDDPVGAVSVHAVAGAWGTLAVGLFHRAGPSLPQLASQAIGILVCFAWSFGAGCAAFWLGMRSGGLRVQEQAEQRGLDLWEHDAEAYPADLSSAGDSIPPEPATPSSAGPSRAAAGQGAA